MSNINKAAVLNPFSDLTDSVLEYIPRATTTEFGIVAIGSGINVDILGRIYLDTQEYSDRLTAIEAKAASTLATQKSEVAAAIAQVNLTQSQTITALTLEVSNLKTNLTDSIAATQAELINRADQLAQDVTDITVQLTQDKATFTQDIQDALDFLKDDAYVASALRHPRKIQGVEFDGTKDISLPTFTTQTDGLVPKRVGATSTKYLREDGTWVVPTNTTYALLTSANAEAGSATTANSISAKVLKDAILYHTPEVTDITGNAGTSTKLQTSRTISLTGGVTGSVSFDGSEDASITTTVTGLGVANGIATLDSNGQVPSTQLPSYVDDVLEYVNVAAFPTIGVAGKIYVETTGNTTYRWGGTAYVKITSGEVSTVAGKSGVVTLTKADVGLSNVDNTADSSKSVASATKLTTARTIGGVSFNGTANIDLPGVNITGNQSTTGNADTATTLQTACTINGTSFNGSANITTANWGTARTLTLGSTGKSVNGSADVSWSADEILPTGTSGQVLKHNGTSWVAGADSNTTYSVMTEAEASTGTATTARLITSAVLKSAIATHAPVQTSISGNAATATKLATARTINGVAFDGTTNINLPTASTSTSGTVQLNNTLTSTSTTQALTAAQGKKLQDEKLPYTGGTLTGPLTLPNLIATGGVKGSLTHDSSYLIIHPYNESYNDGSVLRFHWDGNNSQLIAGKSGGSNAKPILHNMDLSGNAATATKLRTARTIALSGGVTGTATSFDGSGNITIPVTSVDATKLSGTASISTTGNANTATKLKTARKINGVAFDGSADITVADNTKLSLAGGTMSGDLMIDRGSSGGYVYIRNTSSEAQNSAFYAENNLHKGRFQASFQGHLGIYSDTFSKYIVVCDGKGEVSLKGNAETATKLQTARTINGVSFDGTANITVADSTKLPLAGGTMTGALKVNNTTASTSATTGAITTTGGVGIGGALFTTGAITSANNITAYSDSRIKDNITLIDDALNKVNQLKGVTFNRTDLDDKDKRYVGLIAQDVQSVMSEAVNVNNDEISTLSVDYQGLVGLLVESIKELKLEIDVLKERVK